MPMPPTRAGSPTGQFKILVVQEKTLVKNADVFEHISVDNNCPSSERLDIFRISRQVADIETPEPI
jgi:uncharacterized protein (UPF0147 family)